MGKYQKKPVVIDAWLWDETKETLEVLLENGLKYTRFESHATENYVRRLGIQTLEGRMTAEKGDWIIKGVKGEFYPCKPDVFEATYTEVTDCPQCWGEGEEKRDAEPSPAEQVTRGMQAILDNARHGRPQQVSKPLADMVNSVNDLPPSLYPCKRCKGDGDIWKKHRSGETYPAECPRCLGSGLEPE